MAFQTSNDVFDAVFGKEQDISPAESFLTEISDYMKTRVNVPGAVDLGKWISAGKPLCTFTCREELTETLAENLREGEIPYVVLFTETGQAGFIIREPDGDKADEIKAMTLARASRICKVVSGNEMMHFTAASKAKDKSCLAFHGLTQAQAFCIRDAYAKNFIGSQIGMDRMSDNTYTLTIMANNAIKKNARDGAVDICTIMLDTVMKTTGPNGSRNSYYAELEEEYRLRLAKNFQEPGVNLNRTPLWIIGKGTQFIKITATGFSYGHAIVQDDKVNLREELQAEDNQPDYRQLLISYTRRIPYKVFTYNTEAVIYHFQNKTEDDELDLADISPEPIYYVWKRGEQQLVKELDKIMTRKLNNEEIMIMDGRWHEKFSRYMAEAQAVLQALSIGRLPPGYEPGDLATIRSILDKHKMEAGMYEQGIEALKEIQAVPILETVERIVDVQKTIGITKETIEREKQKEREERAAAKSRGKTPAKSTPTAPGTPGKDKEEEVER